MIPDERISTIAKRKQPLIVEGRQVRHPLWVQGEYKYFDIWKVPIECLVLNVDNKRFAAERELVEHRLGRPLDPANIPSDEESIIAILCDSNLDVDPVKQVATGTPSKDFLALKEDWQDRGQIEPFWIRPDGVVHNGNRRLALLKCLLNEGADCRWAQALILPYQEVDESELFRMEQREQLAENFKMRYQDVNALLALRDAAELENIDWDDPQSITMVASRLKHYAGKDDASYASKQLYAIRALDNYLDYINARGQYSLAIKQVEVFRELGLCMSMYMDEPEEQSDLLQAAFAFVQAGRTYLELRQLRKLFSSDRVLFNQMASRIDQVELDSGWDPDSVISGVEYPELRDATASDDEDEDSDENDTTNGISVGDYPVESVGTVIDGTLDKFIATNLEVNKLLDQVISRLESVKPQALRELRDSDRESAIHKVTWIAEWGPQAKDWFE